MTVPEKHENHVGTNEEQFIFVKAPIYLNEYTIQVVANFVELLSQWLCNNFISLLLFGKEATSIVLSIGIILIELPISLCILS